MDKQAPLFSIDILQEQKYESSLSSEIKSQLDIFAEGMKKECNVEINTEKLGALRYQIEPTRRLLFKVQKKRNKRTGEIKIQSHNLGILEAQFKLQKLQDFHIEQKRNLKDIQNELKDMISFNDFQSNPLLPEPIHPEQRLFKRPIPPQNMRIVAPGLPASAEEQMHSIIENPFFGSLTPQLFTKGRDCYSHKYVIKGKK